MKPSIFSLPEYIDSLSGKNRAIFKSIFSLETSNVPFSYESPESLDYLAKRFYTDKKNLLSRKTISITNWILGEQTLFNPLRTNRPTQIFETTRGDSKICDFCEVRAKTPADPFGRIETSLSITAANASAYVGLHSLIIPKTIHSLSDMTKDIFLDVLETANVWFAKAHAYDPQAIFPSIIFNSSARAGASIFHPHVQVLLTRKPFQKIYGLHEKSQIYQEKYNKSFFTEFAKTMDFLQLATIKHSLTSYAHITPIREREVMLLGKGSTTPLPYDFIEISYSLYEWYTKKLGVKNFNMGIILPPLAKIKDWSDFPILLRLVDRGVDGKPSDIAGLELFFASVVGADPYTYIPSL